MIEAHVINSADAFVRNVVEVVVGQQTRDGLYVERIEPAAVRPADTGEGDVAANPGRIVTWQAASRLIPHSAMRPDGTIEQDPVTYRVHRSHVREVALALLAYADGDQGGPPGDASALRRDLDAERFEHAKTRERMADLTDVIARIAEREPLVLDPVIVKQKTVKVVEPKVHVIETGDGYTGPSVVTGPTGAQGVQGPQGAPGGSTSIADRLS